MKQTRSRVIDTLLHSDEPSIRWKVLVRVLREDPHSTKIRELHEEIRASPRVKALLAGGEGRSAQEPKVYAKYRGAHWVLAALAEIGYPPGDESMLPMCHLVLRHWLSTSFYQEFESKSAVPKHRSVEGVPIIRGRHRRCASQQGNALYSLTALDLAQEGRQRLAERLLHWQWPDGGWNCDRNPKADTSSFMETLLPMRGLAAYGELSGDRTVREAALRASEVFLSRRLFKRRSDGKVIHPNFRMLHYPLYWHYDVLGGLKAMAEMGLVRDSRCNDALDLLERKELSNGGWPAEGRFYSLAATSDPDSVHGSHEWVNWGGSGKSRMNEWITVDALFVLRAAGRL
jgi:hypothetical protein